MAKDTSLGDLLRAYWQTLPQEKKDQADRKRLLLEAFTLVDDSLQPFTAPAALLEEGGRDILVLFASNTIALRALRQRAKHLREEIEAVLGLRVDEVRVALRPQGQVDHMRDDMPKKGKGRA
jgi:adenylate kinase family enzyme